MESLSPKIYEKTVGKKGAAVQGDCTKNELI